MGKSVPGVPLVTINSDGESSPEQEEGDIAVEVKAGSQSCFGIFERYIGATSGKLDRRVKGFAGGGRYCLTGDRAAMDGDGYFHFVGRSDDVINSSGYRIGAYLPPLIPPSERHLHQAAGPFDVESTSNCIQQWWGLLWLHLLIPIVMRW